jgi:hypothetical protein
MGSKPKAPDMSFQVEAARKQEEELARQRADIEAKKIDTATENTEKLRGLRRSQSGRLAGQREVNYSPFTPTPPPPKKFRPYGKWGKLQDAVWEKISNDATLGTKK